MAVGLESDTLEKGIRAAKAGNRLLGRLHLLRAADTEPNNPNCWLWLAWVAETPADAAQHLQRVLKKYPNHRLAQIGLLWTQCLAEFESGKDLHHLELPDSLRGMFAAPADAPKVVDQRPYANTSDPPSGSTSYSTVEESRSQEVVTSEAPGYPQTESTYAESTQNVHAVTPTADVDSHEANAYTVHESAAPAGESGGYELSGTATSLSEDSQEQVEQDHTLHGGSSTVAPAADLSPRVNEFASEEEEQAPSELESSEFERVTEPQTQASGGTTQLNPPPTSAGASTKASPAGPEKTAAEAKGAPLILVVDDSATVRKLVTMTLESRNYRVLSASNGYEALQKITETKPALVFTDINMPRLDGYQLCKLIKKHPNTKHIHVVMLSGKDGMFDKLRGKLAGSNDYITKPFDVKDLLKKVETYLPSPK